MKEIKLTHGFIALVDDEDWETFSKFKWYPLRSARHPQLVYAHRGEGPRLNHREVYMHRQIMNAPKGITVDHINRDGLDNRKSNLRIATQSQQMANTKTRKDKLHSQFRGVTWTSAHHTRHWLARIVRRHLGCFSTQEEAAMAYNKAAQERWGQFASLNQV